MGRKPKLTAYQIKEARERIAKGEKTRDVGRFSMPASARFRGLPMPVELRRVDPTRNMPIQRCSGKRRRLEIKYFLVSEF
jgi:hypothetical protein